MKLLVYLFVSVGFSLAVAGSYDSFFRAVVRDDVAALAELVDRGFDPNARDENGQPAITRALQADSVSAALGLAAMPGLDVNARNRVGETPLMMAAIKGQFDVSRALIERGAAIDPPGWTPLHYAAAGNSLPVLALLIRHGASIDARAPNGRTALMMAAMHADESVVQALLAAGSDPRARDASETSAGDLARRAGRDRLADRLAGEVAHRRQP